MVGRSLGWLLDRMLGCGVVGWGGWMSSRASSDGERKPCDISPALPTQRHVCPFARCCGRVRWIVVGFVDYMFRLKSFGLCCQYSFPNVPRHQNDPRPTKDANEGDKHPEHVQIASTGILQTINGLLMMVFKHPSSRVRLLSHIDRTWAPFLLQSDLRATRNTQRPHAGPRQSLRPRLRPTSPLAPPSLPTSMPRSPPYAQADGRACRAPTPRRVHVRARSVPAPAPLPAPLPPPIPPPFPASPPFPRPRAPAPPELIGHLGLGGGV